jgi:predicted homoserine dehydrogenase-like protein
MIDNVEVARAVNALPMGLTDGAVLRKSVAADTMLTLEDVDLPAGREVDRLRSLQDRTFAA